MIHISRRFGWYSAALVLCASTFLLPDIPGRFFLPPVDSDFVRFAAVFWEYLLPPACCAAAGAILFRLGTAKGTPLRWVAVALAATEVAWGLAMVFVLYLGVQRVAGGLPFFHRWTTVSQALGMLLAWLVPLTALEPYVTQRQNWRQTLAALALTAAAVFGIVAISVVVVAEGVLGRVFSLLLAPVSLPAAATAGWGLPPSETDPSFLVSGFIWMFVLNFLLSRALVAWRASGVVGSAAMDAT